MTDIWLVTKGEYSSYHVVAAFTSVEAADEFARVSNLNQEDGWSSKHEVERIDLDPPTPEVVQRTVKEVTPAPPACLPDDVIEALQKYVTNKPPDR